MNNSSSNNNVEGLFYSLILFASSAKLWITLNNNNNNSNNGARSDENDDHVATNNVTPSSSRFRRRNSRTTGIVEALSPVHRRSRGMSEEERMLLMERVSISDSVLTRDSSLDLCHKNSNWSHFEKFNKYAPSFDSPKTSTIAEEDDHVEEAVDDEEEEQHEHLWSETLTEECPETDAALKQQQQQQQQQQNNNDVSFSMRNNLKQQLSRQNSLSSNATCLPSKLILIRHGQSEGNIDEVLYATKPDNAMRLTKLGWEMARMAGKALREQLPPNETVHFIVSPYARTVETFHGLASAWCDPEEFSHIPNRSKRLKLWYSKLMEMGLTWHEDPRIREQDFGNYQDPHAIVKAKSERHRFGAFYYRFPHGESASDVFDRVSTFLDSLWRSFESGRAQNYVLVAHGISIRVFLTRYFRYSIDQFHMLANPKNCEMITLGHDGSGRLLLDGRCELELSEKKEKEGEGGGGGDDGKNDAQEANGKDGNGGEQVQKKGSATAATVVTGYKNYSKLRTLPPQYVQPRSMRMSWNDN